MISQCPVVLFGFLQVLLPRSSPCDAVFKKLNTDGSSADKSYTFVQVLHKLGNFEKSCRMIKEREGREMPFFAQLRHDNSSRLHTKGQACLSCNGETISNNFLSCELCKGSHHLECVAVSRTKGALTDPYFNLFLCVSCVRTRRPTLAEACKLYKDGTMSHIYLPELAALIGLIRRAQEWQMKISEYLTGLLTESNGHSATESSPSSPTKLLSPKDVATARSEEATATERSDSQPADSDVVNGENGEPSDASTTQVDTDAGFSPTNGVDLSSLSTLHKALLPPLSDNGISETASTATAGTALFNTGVQQHSRLDLPAVTAQLQVSMCSVLPCLPPLVVHLYDGMEYDWPLELITPCMYIRVHVEVNLQPLISLHA